MVSSFGANTQAFCIVIYLFVFLFIFEIQPQIWVAINIEMINLYWTSMIPSGSEGYWSPPPPPPPLAYARGTFNKYHPTYSLIMFLEPLIFKATSQTGKIQDKKKKMEEKWRKIEYESFSSLEWALKRKLSSGKRWKIICEHYSFLLCKCGRTSDKTCSLKSMALQMPSYSKYACDIVQIGGTGFLRHVFV